MIGALCTGPNCGNFCDKVGGVTKTGKVKYRALCKSCAKKPWAKFKKNSCDYCGFVPIHSCQLDVDHIDGNKQNNDPSNFQTLCANCHRLKTKFSFDTENHPFLLP